MFADRLTRAMDALGVTNAALAGALNVDPSSISRIKTGTRGMPKEHVVRKISQYLSSCCDAKTQTELYELTGNAHFLQNMPVEERAVLLDEWLQAQAYSTSSEMGYALRGAELHTPVTAEGRPDAGRNGAGEISKLRIYRGGAGKRQALLDLFTMIFNSGGRCVIKVFSDEDLAWVSEDADFSYQISGLLIKLAQCGCRFEHIHPPLTRLNSSMAAVERWLPVSMSGTVNEFYYPYARDELHRRTLIVVENLAAMYSASVAENQQYIETALTDDCSSVWIRTHEFNLILSACRPAMRKYTKNSKMLFNCMGHMEALNADGIFKTSSLSSVTMPDEIIERFSLAGTRLVYNSLRERLELRKNVLREHIVMEIMQLAPVDKVIAGKVMIVNSDETPDGPYYYTAEEYALHIRNILIHLDCFPNYRVVLTDEPLWADVICLSKQGGDTLLLKKSPPMVMFEVLDKELSDAIWLYMKRYADRFMDDGAREVTRAQLREYLRRLYASMK